MQRVSGIINFDHMDQALGGIAALRSAGYRTDFFNFGAEQYLVEAWRLVPDDFDVNGTSDHIGIIVAPWGGEVTEAGCDCDACREDLGFPPH
jgi:hypothetical protein